MKHGLRLTIGVIALAIAGTAIVFGGGRDKTASAEGSCAGVSGGPCFSIDNVLNPGVLTGAGLPVGSRWVVFTQAVPPGTWVDLSQPASGANDGYAVGGVPLQTFTPDSSGMLAIYLASGPWIRWSEVGATSTPPIRICNADTQSCFSIESASRGSTRKGIAAGVAGLGAAGHEVQATPTPLSLATSTPTH